MSSQYEKGPMEFPFGYTTLADRKGKNSNMNIDFGILRLKAGEEYAMPSVDEKAILLVYGEVTLSWEGKSETVQRDNCFDVSPYALSVPSGVEVKITGVSDDSELNLSATDNDKTFASKLYVPSDTPDEFRGKGLMQEASTRIVRTIFDYSTRPESNLVLGEVIGFPGKWSSYPPHHHAQPEIYYYKFQPKQGFGFADLGTEAVKLEHNGIACIEPGNAHPHVTAPGYSIWYIWVIRHIDGDPYITPTFEDEHLWVLEEGAKYGLKKKLELIRVKNKLVLDNNFNMF